jgi:hypothetical protein
VQRAEILQYRGGGTCFKVHAVSLLDCLALPGCPHRCAFLTARGSFESCSCSWHTTAISCTDTVHHGRRLVPRRGGERYGMTHFSGPFKTRSIQSWHKDGWISGDRPSEVSFDTDVDVDVDVETLPGQAGVCMFACLPRGHSTAIHSQRMPLPLPLPSPTIHTCLNPCPCLFLVAVRHVSLM